MSRHRWFVVHWAPVWPSRNENPFVFLHNISAQAWSSRVQTNWFGKTVILKRLCQLTKSIRHRVLTALLDMCRLNLHIFTAIFVILQVCSGQRGILYWVWAGTACHKSFGIGRPSKCIFVQPVGPRICLCPLITSAKFGCITSAIWEWHGKNQ